MAMKLDNDNREAELHNAQISERYQRLLNAENEQFGGHETAQRTYTTRASVLAPERPVQDTRPFEQQPVVTEFRREIESPVFTTDKYEAVQDSVVEFAPPVEQMAVSEVVAPVEKYSINGFAKLVMAGVATVATLMLTVIGINSGIIAKNKIQLNALQERKAELVEENGEIMRRIEEATSEDTIRGWANEKGMIYGRN
jgi:hypothetical protein